MAAALIVAEPEGATRGFLERQLVQDGFQVAPAVAAGEALDLAERLRPDLVLLAELELCLRLREGEPGRSWDRDVPVILLGPEEGDSLVDRVRALERGADDYLDRPFAYEELRARIKALLRRAGPRPAEVLEAGEIRIDRPTRCVSVAGQRLYLAAKEYELLTRLGEEPRRVFTKDELLREIWGFRSPGRTRTLDSHASRLRNKIKPLTETPYVINEWGVGYRLMLPA